MEYKFINTEYIVTVSGGDKDIIKELEGIIGKQIPVDDILLKAKDKGMDPDKAEDILDILKKEGVIFAPRAGFISRI